MGAFSSQLFVARLVAERPTTSYREARNLTAMRAARSCYDHLAGRLGVNIADSMVRQGLLIAHSSEFRITETGEAFLGGFGIVSTELRGMRRSTARSCMDWSERRPHIAGALGAALLDLFVRRRWVDRMPETRGQPLLYT